MDLGERQRHWIPERQEAAIAAHESAQVFYRQQPVYNPQMSSGHERKIIK